MFRTEVTRVIDTGIFKELERSRAEAFLYPELAGGQMAYLPNSSTGAYPDCGARVSSDLDFRFLNLSQGFGVQVIRSPLLQPRTVRILLMKAKLLSGLLTSV